MRSNHMPLALGLTLAMALPGCTLYKSADKKYFEKNADTDAAANNASGSDAQRSPGAESTCDRLRESGALLRLPAGAAFRAADGDEPACLLDLAGEANGVLRIECREPVAHDFSPERVHAQQSEIAFDLEQPDADEGPVVLHARALDPSRANGRVCMIVISSRRKYDLNAEWLIALGSDLIQAWAAGAR